MSSRPLHADSGSDSMVADLRRAIHAGELAPGQRIAPLRQLAETYGISMSAARSAVTQLKEAGLLRGRQGSGVYVDEHADASDRATRRVRWVALLMDVRGHVYGPLCEQLSGHLEASHYRTVKVGFGRRHRDDQTRIQTLLDGWAPDPPDAIVFQQGGEKLRDAIEQRFNQDSRLIAVDQVGPNTGTPWHSVGVDPDQLVNVAVDYLLERGHQRIGFLTNARKIDPDSRRERPKRDVGHTAYILALGEALRRRGLHHALSVHYRARQVPHQPDGPEANPFMETNLQSLREWLQRDNRPTAVFGSDVRVAAAMRAARDIGLEPGVDLVGLGVGNTPWSHAFGFPSLSRREDLIALRIAELVTAPPDRMSDTTFQLTVPAMLPTESTEAGALTQDL